MTDEKKNERVEILTTEEFDEMFKYSEPFILPGSQEELDKIFEESLKKLIEERAKEKLEKNRSITQPTDFASNRQRIKFTASTEQSKGGAKLLTNDSSTQQEEIEQNKLPPG